MILDISTAVPFCMHIYIPQHVLRILTIMLFCMSFLGYRFMFAQTFNPPTALPPGSNIDAPLNVGTSAQVKNGGLGVNSLAVFGATTVTGSTTLSQVLASSVNVSGNTLLNQLQASSANVTATAALNDVTASGTAVINKLNVVTNNFFIY